MRKLWYRGPATGVGSGVGSSWNVDPFLMAESKAITIIGHRIEAEWMSRQLRLAYDITSPDQTYSPCGLCASCT